MKKEIKRDDEVVTRGILRQELKAELDIELKKVRGEFKRAHNKLRDELHGVEYRLDNKIDRLGADLRAEMSKQTQIFQDLADQVIGTHKNFEVESVSIKQNYNHLKTRVKKVEEVVFPGSV